MKKSLNMISRQRERVILLNKHLVSLGYRNRIQEIHTATHKARVVRKLSVFSKNKDILK